MQAARHVTTGDYGQHLAPHGLDDLPNRVRAPGQGIGRLRLELPDEGLSLERSNASCYRPPSKSMIGIRQAEADEHGAAVNH